MSEEPHRSKRIRKPRRLYDSQNDYGEGLGHAHTSYARTKGQQLSEQRVSQAPQQDSKLLVKFVNSANKRLREWQAAMRRKEMESIREPVAVRDYSKTREQDSSQRVTGDSRGGKIQLGRKNKQTIYFKGPNNGTLPNQTEDMLRQIQSITHQSAATMRNLQKGMVKGKVDLHNNKKPGNQPQIDSANLRAAKAKEQMQRSRGEKMGEPRSHPMLGSDERARRIREVEQKLDLPRSDLMSNKVFKRSSYHVAIAYHIYLKQASQSGVQTNVADPTLHARKLKEGMSKQT